MPDLRIGLIGLDTSHVTAFTKLLNDPTDPHHVAGGKVAVAWPGEPSMDFKASHSRVEGFTAELRDKHGIRVVGSAEAVAEACDVVFIESVDGRVHLDLFRRVARFKKPVFIDKPFAVTSRDAREIVRIAKEQGVQVMSCSSLRYSEKLQASLARKPEEAGAIIGCDACGPMSIEPTQPGFFWYGIHTVEMVNAVMGNGCRRVSVMSNEDFDLLTGVWADGRMATVRGLRKGAWGFGLTLHREKGSEFINCYEGRPPYAGMLEAILRTLARGQPEIEPEATLEIIRLIEAANESRQTGNVVEV